MVEWIGQLLGIIVLVVGSFLIGLTLGGEVSD